jgi:hypothetical protein
VRDHLPVTECVRLTKQAGRPARLRVADWLITHDLTLEVAPFRVQPTATSATTDPNPAVPLLAKAGSARHSYG